MQRLRGKDQQCGVMRACRCVELEQSSYLEKSEGQIIGGLEHPAVAVVLMDNGRGQQMGQGWMAHRKVSPKLFSVDWSLGEAIHDRWRPKWRLL